jgi:hypothetical protein
MSPFVQPARLRPVVAANIIVKTGDMSRIFWFGCFTELSLFGWLEMRES